MFVSISIGGPNPISQGTRWPAAQPILMNILMKI
jgi:hypothetical protein